MPPDKTIAGSPMDWLARAKGSLVLAKQPKNENLEEFGSEEIEIVHRSDELERLA